MTCDKQTVLLACACSIGRSPFTRIPLPRWSGLGSAQATLNGGMGGGGGNCNGAAATAAAAAAPVADAGGGGRWAMTSPSRSTKHCSD